MVNFELSFLEGEVSDWW